MSSVFKRPYEISLWEDRLTIVDNNGKEYDGFVPSGVQVLTSYYKEKKLAVIGSDTVKAPSYIVEPQLKRKIDGSNILTFSIYSHYWDVDEERLIKNPFLPFLVNERKVKLKYTKKGKIQWLDFVIKNIDEDSGSKKFTYTAEDLFVNELSKTGLGLVFDSKMHNNSGSAQQLGAAALQGTDWQIGESTELIQQKKEEALYALVLNTTLEAHNTLTNQRVLVAPGEIIYTFYSCVANKTENFFQFLYKKDGNYLVDQNRVITDECEYYTSFVNPEGAQWPFFAKEVKYTPDYRGKRLVREQKAIYDVIPGKNVLVYQDPEGREVRGYSTSEYISSSLLTNCFINDSSFSSTTGWQHSDASRHLTLELIPSYKIAPKRDDRIAAFGFINEENSALVNFGFKDNVQELPEIVKDELFSFRIKCGLLSEDGYSIIAIDRPIRIFVGEYLVDIQGNIVIPEAGFLLEGAASLEGKDPEGFLSCDMAVGKTISKQDLLDKRYAIFLQFPEPLRDKNILVQEVQLFKIEYDENGNRRLPSGKVIVITEDGKKTVEESNLVYKKTSNIFYYYDEEAEKSADLNFLSETEIKSLVPCYNDNFEKIRSISISNTNRFNILQTIAETFECWCRIEVKHKDSGEILLGKDVEIQQVYDGGTSKKNLEDYPAIDGGEAIGEQFNYFLDAGDLDINNWYRQQKFITFHSQVGQKSSVNFVYGINLKNIKRKLASGDIVTKLIVKNNNNSSAENGSCSIVEAKNNPSGENFLLNMDYYIKQGLLNYENFYRDLYSTEAEYGWLGYYVNLKTYNNALLKNNQEIDLLKSVNAHVESDLTVAREEYQKSLDDLRRLKAHFVDLTTEEYEKIDPENSLLQDESVSACAADIVETSRRIEELSSRVKSLDQNFEQIQKELKEYERQNSILSNQKQSLILNFEQKYSRYIQEAPWSSDDYYDKELYYFDAESTLHNSSQPKVEYTIEVIELSQIPEYENYAHELGDITNMQDTEFFGWTYKDGIKTPYKEPIVITEETIHFEQPEKDSIKVQNYRTQFEDLFQRLTASAQKVEFQSGAYDRTAEAIAADGLLNSELLQKSLDGNHLILKNADNQSVVWDKKGITATNLKTPSEMIRVTSGGVFLTTDGGVTWTTGITGSGINAQVINTGRLNTSQIVITNGDKESFRWDASGINAYRKREDGSYNINSYVRYDEYGIYGIEGNPDFVPQKLEDVIREASFSLSWRGFHLKNKDNGGSLSLSNDEDFCIKNSNDDIIIQIGRIGEHQKDKNIYGIVIKDTDGKDAFKATQEDGLLVGGWHVSENMIKTLMTNKDGTISPEVVLFSKDQSKEEALQDVCGQGRTDWRITAGTKFGVTKDGAVYAEEMHSDGAIISKWIIQENKIVSARGNIDDNTYQQIELSPAGVTLNIFDINDEFKPKETLSKSWQELLS